MFLEEAPKLLSEIRQAIEEDDDSRLRRAAHTLKSSAQLFEAKPAAEAAFRLERLAKENQQDSWKSASSEVEHEIARLTPRLAMHLDGPGAAKPMQESG